MHPTEIKISDTARLWAVKTHKFKKNLLFLATFLPLGGENTPADLLFPGILLRGTAGYPTNADIKRRLEELYAARLGVSGGYYGDSLLCGFSAEFLSSSAAGADFSILASVIGLMGEVWHSPATDERGLLRPEEVRLAKQARRDQIRAEINNTSAYAARRCRELLCAGEPYGYSVTEDEIMALSPEIITSRYIEVRETSRLNFFYVGQEEPEAVADLLSAAFPPAPRPAGGSLPRLSPTPPVPPGSPRLERGSVMPVSQSKLVMGFTCGGALMDDSRDYYAMCLMSDVLGESPVSKLFVNLRERMSLCYSVGSYYESLKGVLYISSGIDRGKRGAALEEALRCLEDIRRGVISSDELKAAKLSNVNDCRQIEDSPYSILSFCFGRAVRGLDCGIEHFLNNIESLEAGDIAAAARRVELKAVYFLEGEGSGGEEEDEDE